jgi:hypothetical protein
MGSEPLSNNSQYNGELEDINISEADLSKVKVSPINIYRIVNINPPHCMPNFPIKNPQFRKLSRKPKKNMVDSKVSFMLFYRIYNE